MFLQRFSCILLILLVAASVRAQDAGGDIKPEASNAISYGFVIDNSGSFRKLLEDVIQFVGNEEGPEIGGRPSTRRRIADKRTAFAAKARKQSPAAT